MGGGGGVEGGVKIDREKEGGTTGVGIGSLLLPYIYFGLAY